MYRSFTDRVFGGVCGGLVANIRFDAWLLRLLFVLLAVFTLGVAAAMYLALWWALPQESPTESHRGSAISGLAVLLIVVVMLGAWLGQQFGVLSGAEGQNLMWPIVLLMLSLVFFLQQVRG